MALPLAQRICSVFRLPDHCTRLWLAQLPRPATLPRSLPQATGKRFVVDANFKLGDLLRLGLHACVDVCTEIVDRAQKELLVEKASGWGQQKGSGRGGEANIPPVEHAGACSCIDAVVTSAYVSLSLPSCPSCTGPAQD